MITSALTRDDTALAVTVREQVGHNQYMTLFLVNRRGIWAAIAESTSKRASAGHSFRETGCLCSSTARPSWGSGWGL